MCTVHCVHNKTLDLRPHSSAGSQINQQLQQQTWCDTQKQIKDSGFWFKHHWLFYCRLFCFLPAIKYVLRTNYGHYVLTKLGYLNKLWKCTCLSTHWHLLKQVCFLGRGFHLPAVLLLNPRRGDSLPQSLAFPRYFLINIFKLLSTGRTATTVCAGNS